MDATDKMLIALLRKNARTPISALAADLGVTRGTVQARLKRLQGSGAIEGFTLKPGHGVAGVRAHMLIAVEGHRTDAIVQALHKLSSVAELYSTNGKWDLVAMLQASDLRGFDVALSDIRLIPGINRTETSILLASV